MLSLFQHILLDFIDFKILRLWQYDQTPYMLNLYFDFYVMNFPIKISYIHFTNGAKSGDICILNALSLFWPGNSMLVIITKYYHFNNVLLNCSHQHAHILISIWSHLAVLHIADRFYWNVACIYRRFDDDWGDQYCSLRAVCNPL